MLPSPIRPAQPVVPIKRRWHAPEQEHDHGEPSAPPQQAPDPARDVDDEHIDEYAR